MSEIRGPGADALIAAAAARQQGVVSRRQLLAAGIDPDIVDRRVASGRLRRLHHGVYAAGPILGPHATEMAACLACGPFAVVSHGTAAHLWKLLPAASRDGAVDITVRGGTRVRSAVHVHRSTLGSSDVTRLDGIPVTTAARTLFDLAGVVSGRELERALAEAYALRMVTPARLRKQLDRMGRRKGAPALRALLAAGPPALTRTEAEERFIALVRRARLPAPEASAIAAGQEVDFLWRRERLVVEIDGFAFHSSAQAFERDRRRDAVLAAAGLRVMRVTWGQIEGEPEAVLVRLAQALLTR